MFDQTEKPCLRYRLPDVLSADAPLFELIIGGHEAPVFTCGMILVLDQKEIH
jgi:hypothetical protein